MNLKTSNINIKNLSLTLLYYKENALNDTISEISDLEKVRQSTNILGIIIGESTTFACVILSTYSTSNNELQKEIYCATTYYSYIQEPYQATTSYNTGSPASNCSSNFSRSNVYFNLCGLEFARTIFENYVF